MHQTFYIDVDEEISSVIDRLNKSMSGDNYFVVPKRALFLQSIVNLKILKREADKISKRVILVTQDEVAISMAERSGIETCESLDGLNSVGDFYIDQNENEEEFVPEMHEDLEPAKRTGPGQDKQVRLRNVGSGDFYQSEKDNALPISSGRNEKPKGRMTSHASGKRENPEKIVLRKTSKESLRSHGRKSDIIQSSGAVRGSKAGGVFKNQLDPHKAETLERMFSSDSHSYADKVQKSEARSIGNGKMKKVFLVFMLLCSLVFLGVAGYLFFPSAKIVIKSDVTKKKVDIEIKAGNDATIENTNAIPLRVIEKDEQISLSYQVTGAKEVSGKKAHGKVVIYNEYSSEPQTLVATTRLESSDGKIFRLVKNVVVPGSSNVAGQLTPGAIQAEVVADRAGSDYNIDATKFTIPGFAGGPKFDKFYATSDSATTGGSGDGAEADSSAVSQSDFDSAKQKTEAAFKEKISEAVRDGLAPGEIVLSQAEKIVIAKSSASTKIGTVTDSFDWVVSGSVVALVFSEKDVRGMISASSKSGVDDSQVKTEIVKVDYGSVEPDFELSSLNLRVYAELESTPIIDSEKIKKDLLGKNDDKLADILRKYPSIKSADVEFSPSFISKIPNYPSRVNIEIQNEAN